MYVSFHARNQFYKQACKQNTRFECTRTIQLFDICYTFAFSLDTSYVSNQQFRKWIDLALDEDQTLSLTNLIIVKSPKP